jgi:hypothetical protein
MAAESYIGGMTSRLLPCAALLVLAGCDLDDVVAASHSQKFTEDFHRSYALKSGGRIELESFNGPVEVYGWDQEKVEINGAKYASTREALAEIRIDISHTPDSMIVIKTVRPEWTGGRRGNRGVKYRIHVPRKVQFDRVTTSNGSLRLESVEGRGHFRTSNGAIRFLSYKGDVEAHTSNGRIELEGFSGSASLHTSNGPIEAKGIKGSLDATTSNGAIDVETDELDPSRPVKLETSNGPIVLTMGARGGGGPGVRARTSNGPISVRMPEGAGARVRAHTSSHSAVTSELPMNNGTQAGKSHLDGTIGAGGPLLELTTTNGPIKLSRY